MIMSTTIMIASKRENLGLLISNSILKDQERRSELYIALMAKDKTQAPANLIQMSKRSSDLINPPPGGKTVSPDLNRKG